MACSELKIKPHVFCFDFPGWKSERIINNFWLKHTIAAVCRSVLVVVYMLKSERASSSMRHRMRPDDIARFSADN